SAVLSALIHEPALLALPLILAVDIPAGLAIGAIFIVTVDAVHPPPLPYDAERVSTHSRYKIRPMRAYTARSMKLSSTLSFASVPPRAAFWSLRILSFARISAPIQPGTPKSSDARTLAKGSCSRP